MGWWLEGGSKQVQGCRCSFVLTPNCGLLLLVSSRLCGSLCFCYRHTQEHKWNTPPVTPCICKSSDTKEGACFLFVCDTVCTCHCVCVRLLSVKHLLYGDKCCYTEKVSERERLCNSLVVCRLLWVHVLPVSMYSVWRPLLVKHIHCVLQGVLNLVKT